METYVVKSDATLGNQSNDIGVKTPVNITKGQTVTGDIIFKSISGVGNIQGMEYKLPSKVMGMGKPADGMDTFFIPLSNLNVQTSSVPVPVASDKTFQYVVMGGLGIILAIGALKLFKII
jgi:hypothetical protein